MNKIVTHRAIAAHGMSPEVLQAIGDFVVSFAEMEYAIKLGIQTLLDCSHAHKGVVTAHQNVSHLIKMMRELYRTSQNQRVAFETINSLCNEAEQVCTFRNNLMHSTLTTIDEQNFELEKKKKDKQFTTSVQQLNIKALKEKTTLTQNIAGDLICIWMGYHQITPRVA